MSHLPHAPARPRRILLVTVGSSGDLYPYIAIALGLRARGHHATLATSPCYRYKVESLGLPFHPIRPDSDFATDPAAMRRMMHPRWGTVRVCRDILLASLRHTYDDLSAASANADLLISHPLTMPATRLVCERTGLPWVSTMISPLCALSAYDFPNLPISATASRALRLLPPAVAASLFHLVKRATRPMAKPWYRLRSDLGLPPAHDPNPMLDGHSPYLVLALFSRLLAAAQPDWPARTIITGFPTFDRTTDPAMPPALTDFLSVGPPPLVFTLSCSAAMVADAFFHASITAATHLGRRAILITGPSTPTLPTPLPPGIVAHDYAPFSALFPRAAAIIHAGGIGTTGLVMRSGRPSLVVPHAHDQFDNAARLTRLGAARTIPCHRYTPTRVTAELCHLLDDPTYAGRASDIATQMQPEDGVQTACDAVEQLLAGTSGPANPLTP